MGAIARAAYNSEHMILDPGDALVGYSYGLLELQPDGGAAELIARCFILRPSAAQVCERMPHAGICR
jgi:hypothetical protein